MHNLNAIRNAVIVSLSNHPVRMPGPDEISDNIQIAIEMASRDIDDREVAARTVESILMQRASEGCRPSMPEERDAWREIALDSVAHLSPKYS